MKADWVIKLVNKKIIDFREKNGITPSITCMGLTYKPDVDDLRESPALFITKSLDKMFNVSAVEPNISNCHPLSLVDIKTGLKSDICVYLVPHKEFSDLKVRKQDLVFY